MMDQLPTPAPSSDPPMPGSSPTKPSRNAIKHKLPTSGMPFSLLDLNTIHQRAKPCETPPPSSPLGLSPASSPCKSHTVHNPVDPELVEIDPAAGLFPNPVESDEVPHILYTSRSHSLIVGRSKPIEETPIPSKQGLGTKKAMRVNLPNHAKHVSRTHTIIEWIPFVPPTASEASGTFIVRIVGQNGLIVDGKRRREGQVLRLTPGKSVLDFFGVKAKVEEGQQEEKRAIMVQQELRSSPPPTSELVFPSSSPVSERGARQAPALVVGASAQRSVMIGESDDESDESADEDYVPELKRKVLEEPASVKRQRTSSAERRQRTSSAESARATLTESQVQMPPPAAPPAKTPEELQAEARRCVRTLAPTYDLEGLLAGAIVFHRTATISASEAVRSVLATTPGLMQGRAGEQVVAFSPSRRALPSSPLAKGAVLESWPASEKLTRKAWREYLEIILQSSPMFGVINRAGKDASGNPLECWYYYDKLNDPDKERAENLGAFAKPMRKAIKGQKPIFWKKSGYGSKEGDFDVPKGVWEETQPEEKERTWDRVGDLDWKRGK